MRRSDPGRELGDLHVDRALLLQVLDVLLLGGLELGPSVRLEARRELADELDLPVVPAVVRDVRHIRELVPRDLEVAQDLVLEHEAAGPPPTGQVHVLVEHPAHDGGLVKIREVVQSRDLGSAPVTVHLDFRRKVPIDSEPPPSAPPPLFAKASTRARGLPYARPAARLSVSVSPFWEN